MKLCKTIDIDGYKIVAGFSDPQIDPVKTQKAIEKAGLKLTKENRKKLMTQYAIYFQTVDQVIADSRHQELSGKYENLNEHEQLDISGDIIPDYRHATNYKKVSGKWTEEKIDRLGVVPVKSQLTESEHKEYIKDMEAERISKLKTADREAEKESQLDALASEAKHKKDIAEIRGNTFDAVKYFNEGKTAIINKYEV